MSLDEKTALLNQSQFAKRCGVSVSTIRSYVNTQRIVPAKEFSLNQTKFMMLRFLV